MVISRQATGQQTGRKEREREREKKKRNTEAWSKHMKSSKECYLLEQNTTC